MLFASPLNAGPDEEVPPVVTSPGCKEIRVVFAVQFVAPRQVSRINIWLYPLFVAGTPEPVDGALLPVTATKATNLPEALTDGKIASVPTNWPLLSVETSSVDGTQLVGAPVQVSRR
jgi:hypothetical protein